MPLFYRIFLILIENNRLPFGELVAASGAAFAVFFPFDFAGVAGEEPVGSEGVVVGGFGLDEGAGKPEDNGAGLSGGASAVDVNPDIVPGGGIGLDQRGMHVIAIAKISEIIRHVFAVDFHLAGAGSDPDSSNGGFSPTGAPAVFFGTEMSRGRFRLILSFGRRNGSRFDNVFNEFRID